MYFLYSVVLTVGFIILLPRFLWDALTKGKYAVGFWQRFGFLPQFHSQNKPIIWIHCVSVGETQAARPLVKKILEDFPAYQIIVSTTTKTGQKLAQEVFKGEAALVFYFPFDWRFVVRRVLRQLEPTAVLIVETELWFNFLRECKRQDARVALVNGRLSEKSFRRYRLITGFMRRALGDLDLACMQSEADAIRIVELGIATEKVVTTGNIKFDSSLETVENRLTEEFRQRFDFNQQRPLIVAASTHEPEEEVVAAALQTLKRKSVKPLPRLLIVPRHPERFDKVTGLLKQKTLTVGRRSDAASERDKTVDIIVLDSIGELRAVYPLADVVFVGGSLIPHGGQNVLEPAAARRPIVTGFYTANFAAVVNVFLAADALVQLPQIEVNLVSENLADALAELLANDARRKQLADNAFAVLQSNRGATARTIECLRKVLPKV